MERRIAIIALFCACYWPLSHFLDTNIIELQKSNIFPIWQGLVLCSIIFMLAIFVVSAVWIIKPEFLLSFIFIEITLVLLFFTLLPVYESVKFLLKIIGITKGYFILFPILCVILLVGVWILSLKKLFRQSISVGIIIGSLFPLVNVLFLIDKNNFYSIDREEISTGNTSGRNSYTSNKTFPNIYYVVADGFMGDRGHKRMVGESLSYFTDNFKNRDFYYAEEAYANYLSSRSSIASLFHLEYFIDDETKNEEISKSSYFPAILRRDPPPHTINFLKLLGYNLFMSGSWYSGCESIYFECITEKKFRINREARVILSRTIFELLFPYFDLFDLKYDSITPVINNYFEKIHRKEKLPSFLYIHHMQPHNPWYTDGKCQRVITKSLDKDKLYRDSVQCLNLTFSLLIDKIDANDPNAIVVLQGDHGWHRNEPGVFGKKDTELSLQVLEQNAEIINLIRSPKRCHKWLKNDLGPLNTMRFVLSCAQNLEPDYLSELLHITTEQSENGYPLMLFDKNKFK